MSARKRESTKKLKVSKKEIEKLSNNERMLNKKKENSFRIILATKMAEILAFKIWRNIFFKLFFFFGFLKNQIEKELQFDYIKTIFIVLALKMAEIGIIRHCLWNIIQDF